MWSSQLVGLIMVTIIVLVNGQFPPLRQSPCKRECDGRPRVCKFYFVVEQYSSMDAMSCYGCPNVEADCYRQDCIVAGGIRRNIIVVNRQLPGPPIEVCQHDIVEVTVENIMINDESTTIHWHGQHMIETPYMDGVPYVTQCPIIFGTNFTYRIQATEPGTHFWHSHEKLQRGDGMFGMLVVNVPKSEDPHRHLYDEDLTEHQIMITDWTFLPRMDVYGQFAHGGNLPSPDAILIKGAGYMDMANINPAIPLAQINVQRGKRYRLRFVNAEFFDCPLTVSIDRHAFTIISADGFDVEPQRVDYFNIFAGERYDMILEANQPVGTYWMRVRGLEMCEGKEVFQVGVLRYANSPDRFPRTPMPTYATAAPTTGLYFNPLLGDEPGTLRVNELKALDKYPDILKSSKVIRHFFKFSFEFVENPTEYRFPFYGLRQVAQSLQIPTPMMNDIGYLDPPMPLLPNRYEFSSRDFCTNKTAYSERNCTVDYCRCTHVVQLPMHQPIEIILFDNGVRAAHHPVHLHGYGFYVVAWKRVGNFTSRAEIEELDRRGLIERNFKNPSQRDVIPVPRGGYAIIRFYTDNPGFWMMHCHVDIHADDGMRMVFKVGENHQMKREPRDFPSCGNFPNHG